MKYEYKLGKSNSWSESAVVGIIAGCMCVVGAVLCTIMPVLFLGIGVVLVIAGITGFLKRVN